MALVRLGGHDSVLCSADARGGGDQVEPAEDHRRRDGLAVRQRAEEGAKGMITRRALLRGVAGTAGLLGWPPGHASGEPPPETTRLRIAHFPSLCGAPQFIVGELLKAEGFSDIEYVKTTTARLSKALASGRCTSR